jgi:tRNA A-37 threonylcarbamoyl transferase component Bud32
VKSCPSCQRVYPNDAGFCPADGTGLVFTSMVPIAKSDDPRIGQRLANRYELRRVVADGGMGRVYEGVDKQGDRRIAVKVLHDDVSRDEIALERFKREWEISQKLPHPNIVNVFDFQRDASLGVWLLVMEFLDGEELRIVLKREKVIPPERVIRMVAQVALALDAAHATKFVHRDLKPDNLFLCGTREGDIAKVLDFGSVKDKNTDAKKLTVLGTTIGSPYYMAPEQAQGLDTLDARADVFALAAIAYECIVGTVPFEGSNGPSILLAILTKDPEPPSVKGAKSPFPIPPGLDDVMEEALAKNPNIRTQSVGKLADAIGHAYGLEGDHLLWATVPQTELARQLAEARPRVMQKKVAFEAAVDPFAAPPGGHHQGGQQQHGQQQQGGQQGYPPGGGFVQQPQAGAPSYARGMDQAFSNVRQASYDTAADGPMGIPGIGSGERPPWLIPVVVGAAALVVGGGLALVFALAH